MASYDPNDPMDAWFFNKTGSKLQKLSQTYGAPLSAVQQYTVDVRNAGVSYGNPIGGGGSAQAGNYAMGGGGGGSLDALAKQLMDQLTASQAEAKAANEQRYSEILGLYDKRYGDVMSNISGMGTQARKDIGQRARERQANMSQQMLGRGLLGSTVAATTEAVTAREAENEYGRLEEAIRQQTTGLMERMQKEKMDFMERRTDTGPDMNAYANLLSSLGAAVGGGASNSIASSSYGDGGGGVAFGAAASGGGFVLGSGGADSSAFNKYSLGAADFGPRYSGTSQKATDYKTKWKPATSLLNYSASASQRATSAAWRNQSVPTLNWGAIPGRF